MQIKKRKVISEIKEKFNNIVEVDIKFEEGYSYPIIAHTSNDIVEKILQEKIMFI